MNLEKLKQETLFEADASGTVSFFITVKDMAG